MLGSSAAIRWSAPATAWAASPSAISSTVPVRAGDVGGSAGSGTVDRIADRHADRHRQAGRVATHSLAGVEELAPNTRQSLVRAPEPGQVPGVCVARRELQHPGLPGGHQDRQVRTCRRQQDGVAGRDELAGQVRPTGPKQAA